MAAWLAYNLNEKLVEALVACGFNSPTEIQEKSLVYATHPVDLIVASKTGSGKTLTYLVPILNSICNAIDKDTFEDLQMSLILLPTRELAIQVETVLKKVIDHLRASYPDTKIKTCTIAGGFSEEKQLRVLSSHPKVVVGTVGRIWDLLQNAKSEDLKAIASSNFLILDEIDRIIDLGQMKELQQVLRYIENPKGFKFTSGELEEAEMHQVDFDEAVTGQMQFVEDYDEDFDKQFLSGSKTAGVNHQTNKTRKTYVISATLGKAFFTSRMMTKKVKSDLKKIMKHNPETVPNMKLKEIMKYITFKNKTKIIDMTTDVLLPETLEVMKVDVLKEDKMLYLYYFANLYKDKPMIIFTNSISSSNRIKSLLSLGNLNCTSLHSKMQQNHRIKKLDSFREGKVNILICTDVASRGLDIPEVEVVINVHCPKDIDTLVHRSGRTARMGKSGKSIIIADGEDRKRLTKYKKDFGFDKMKNINVPLSNLEPLKPVIDRMKILEKADFKEASQSRDLKWKHKTAEEIGVDASEEEPEEEGAAAKKKLEIKSKKENIRQNLSNKNVQQYSQGRKNVYLSLEEIKKISEQLNELKKEKASEIRDQSRTRDKPVDDKPLKYIVKPARDPTKKRMKARYSNGNNFITGPFGIAERNLGKRKPSIKQKSGSKKKYKRK